MNRPSVEIRTLICRPISHVRPHPQIATAVSFQIIIKNDRSRREILIGNGRAQCDDGRSTGETAAKSTHLERWSARQSERPPPALTHLDVPVELANSIEYRRVSVLANSHKESPYMGALT